MRAIAPLQEQVRERGLWAAHLPPELGGQGFGQVKLGLMHEILGSSPFAPVAFGNQAPDSGNSEVLALAGTEDQKEQWLHPLLAGDLRSAFSMTEPDTAGSDPTLLADARGRGRRLVGHQRPQVVLHQRLGGRLPDRHGGHRPGGAQVPARLDVHRAGRHAGRADPARRADHGAPVRALRRLRRARRDPLRGRPRAEGRAARRARRRLPDRPAAAGAGAHPPLHALARGVSPGVRHAVRARADALLARVAAGRQADGAELDRRLGGRDARGAADDAARRLEDGRRRRFRGAAGDRADQVLRREGAARRGRPGAAGARLARLLDRPAARADVPLRARRPALRRARRGAPPERRAPDPARLRGARRTACRPSTSRPAARPPERGSRTCSRR